LFDFSKYIYTDGKLNSADKRAPRELIWIWYVTVTQLPRWTVADPKGLGGCSPWAWFLPLNYCSLTLNPPLIFSFSTKPLLFSPLNAYLDPPLSMKTVSYLYCVVRTSVSWWSHLSTQQLIDQQVVQFLHLSTSCMLYMYSPISIPSFFF
jgi:hypothetical protein